MKRARIKIKGKARGNGTGAQTVEVARPKGVEPIKLSPPPAKPKGKYETPDPKDPRPITRQNETADLLAAKGYDVEMLPATKGGNGHGIKPESNPDLLINGEAYDVFSPNTGNVRNIWSTVEYKSQTQAKRVVLNLDDYPGPMDKIESQFYNWKIDTLDELLIVKDGSITRLLPK